MRFAHMYLAKFTAKSKKREFIVHTMINVWLR